MVFLILCVNGCALTTKVADKARGYTSERINLSQIKKGDKVGYEDAREKNCYVIQFPQEKDNSKLEMPTIPPRPGYFYICKPHPAYYALIPLTIPIDIVIFPYNIVWFYGQMCAGAGG